MTRADNNSDKELLCALCGWPVSQDMDEWTFRYGEWNRDTQMWGPSSREKTQEATEKCWSGIWLVVHARHDREP